MAQQQLCRWVTSTIIGSTRNQLDKFRSSSTCHRRFLSSSAAGAPSQTTITPPTTRQLRIVAMRSAIPMVGFGFMDNIVMIQAGEAIDMSIGVSFGLSTLTAAGFGQCVSDVAGFTCGGIVDAGVAKLNLPQHNLTPQQLDMKITRSYNTFGGCVGVVTGCLLGMSCLLFMDTDKADRAKKANALKSIFESVLDGGHELVNAERASLWLLDQDNKKEDLVWSRVSTGTKGVIQAPVKGSIVGTCITSGDVLMIEDAYKDDRFNKDNDLKTGFHTKSILAVPVRNEDNKVIGAIQMINKKKDDGTDGIFDNCDVKVVKLLASHTSKFIQIVNE